MEYQLQVTLKKIEITNPNIKDTRLIAELEHAGVTKRIANPRFIRNRLGSFYLQRLSISSTDAKLPNSKAILRIIGLGSATGDEKVIGQVQFNLKALFSNIEKEGSRTQSCHSEQENFSIEYDIQLSVKKNQQSFFESESHSSLSIEQHTEKGNPQPVQNTIQSSFKKDSNSASKVIDFNEKKIEGMKLLDALEKTLGKEKRDDNVSPARAQLKRSVDSAEKTSDDLRDSRQRKAKIARKDSGNSARANVFKSRRGNKGEDASPGQDSPNKQQEILEETPANNVETQVQQVEAVASSPATANLTKTFATENARQQIGVKTPPKTLTPQKIVTPSRQARLTPPKLQKSVTPPKDKPRKSALKTPSIQIHLPPPAQQQIKIVLQDPEHNLFEFPASSPNLDGSYPANQAQQCFTPRPSQNPQIPQTDEGGATWKRKLPHIDIPQTSFESNKLTVPGISKHYSVGEPQEVPSLVKHSQSDGNAVRPRRSSFRISNNGDDSSIHKKAHVHYAPQVTIKEIDAEIRKLDPLFTKRDLKRNIIIGLVSLIVGYAIGSL